MMRSEDSQALLLLCARLERSGDTRAKPLSPGEWHSLSSRLPNASFQRPGELLGQPAATLEEGLELSAEEAERFAFLLDRGATLAIELERLESLGIWVVTALDDDYPSRFRDRLGTAAPPLVYGSGDLTLIGRPGLAVVGSRHVEETAQQTAAFIGNACAACGLVVYSGGAQGVDRLAMNAALEEQSQAVGVLADSLERTIRSPDTREQLSAGNLTLLSPYAPKAGFSVGAAMGRNKLIYSLADYALVVASDAETGGTWAGATEALKAKWVPVFACDGPDVPEGNRLLLKKGALPFPMPFDGPKRSLKDWLAEHHSGKSQRELF